MALMNPGEKSVFVKMAGLAATALGDLVFPPRCLACGGAVDAQGNLCPACWKEISFLARPYCECCGYPFGFPADDGILCAACIADPKPYGKARAIMHYGEGARKIILRLKHADRLENVRPLARWLMAAGGDLLATADYILPVPLHRRRLFQRRYNQSALLSRELMKISGRPMLTQALLRIRATPPQQGLKRRERHENMRGAFAVSPKYVARLQGQRVVLIDDVFTTGATVEACARVLLKAGAEKVEVLTLARVVLPELVNI